MLASGLNLLCHPQFTLQNSASATFLFPTLCTGIPGSEGSGRSFVVSLDTSTRACDGATKHSGSKPDKSITQHLCIRCISKGNFSPQLHLQVGLQDISRQIANERSDDAPQKNKPLGYVSYRKRNNACVCVCLALKCTGVILSVSL